MRKIALMLVLLSGVLLARAQDLRVKGRVTDDKGAILEGVTVKVKGGSAATSTNANGEFTLRAKVGDRIEFTSVGFAAKESEATDSRMDVALTRTAGDLGEVVVVGYGQQRRSTLTSAVSVIKGDQLTKRPVAATSMALQGFAPGVVVQQSSGQPGADGGSIVIRGIGSINGSTAPLIIIDGVEGVSLNDIDPNVIDNITVLKDAASTAVYGVRGTNGVILVRTKRGQAGKTNISFNSFVSKESPTNFPKLLSAVDNMVLNNEAVSNTGSTQLPYPQSLIDIYRTTPANNLTVFDTDWKNLIFQNTGLLQNHNIILSGGSEKISFLASGSYLNQQGLIVNNSFKKYDLRINSDIKLSNRVKFTSDIFYTNSTAIQPAGMSPNEIIQRGISMARNFPAKFGDGQYGDAGQSNGYNPVAFAEASGLNKANTPTISLRFGANIEVFKNFILEAAYNNRSSYTEAYSGSTTYNVYNPNPATNGYVFSRVIGGDSSIAYTYNRNITNQYYGSGTYSYDLRNAHHFKLQAGFQGQDNTFTSVGASRTGLVDPSRPYINLGNAATQRNSGSAADYSLAGFFGRFNYNYDQKYLIELTGRYDGSSRFSQVLDKQWGFFPGGSVGWVFSKENFMNDVAFLNYGKLRASYGRLGNQEVPGGNYPFIAQLNAGTAYYFNGNLTPGSSLNNLPNETLSWETSAQKDLGIDLSMLRNKLSITFDVYQKKISNMLINFPLTSALGYAGSSVIPANAGSMVNNGWEFSATYRTQVRKVNFSITGNLSDVRNKVIDLKGQDVVQGNQISRAGYSVQSYYLYLTDGLYQKGSDLAHPYNGTRTNGYGDIKYRDIDGNDTINAKDRVLLGNNFPRYDYSLNLNADYAGFDLNIFLYGVGKRDNYISGVGVQPFNGGNWIASGLTSALGRWTPDNPNASYPRLYSGGNGNYVDSDFWLRNGAFMRVKQVTLGYTLSKRISDKMKIQQLRFYVNAVNPLTVSHYEPGFDPEVSNTNGSFYPIMKTYTAGINLRF
jgi:TonB-linked SusC/RagA family outer membrane protein